MRATLLACCLAAAGCTQFPELDGVESPAAVQADYPALSPLGGILQRAETGRLTDPAATDDLAARGAALRRRTVPERRADPDLTDRATRLRDRADALRAP
ncbi:hypothetical protein SAMN04490244_101596 [Tranquillimonas rosea]|uniref:Uncharacterized protein n=1 Tax=Tranquillimonas rosea TaxID=641238 RepID=A0A1H9QEH3_9RHOB|nr:hypothetical protein [Tranquillimonas rosea]SER58864.1 hypothetical protein SAMN04490244_101596 [Tranquillimonas rosea]